MFPNEPTPTAFGLIATGVLLAVSVYLSRAALRTGVPVALLFLAVGILAGSQGVGRIAFADYNLAFRVGTVALALILFDGGLNTRWRGVRPAVVPAVLLASVGVVATALLAALGAHWLGFAWLPALLFGAIVSSTDAAAVFSILRGTGLQLRRRLGLTLELESGLNDPVAVILVFELTRALVNGQASGWRMVGQILVQLLVGGACGVAAGLGGGFLLRKARPLATGLYPVLTSAVAALAFGVPTVLDGSGFLAVYVAGVLLGEGQLPYRTGILRVHDAAAWFSQIAMFLLLGLLAQPKRLLPVALAGFALAGWLTLVVRPVAVVLCLAPFRYPARELALIAWAGLRGAVPIILATFPVMAAIPGSQALFDLVFFIVVVNALVPGATVRWASRRLRLQANGPPAPPADIDIISARPLKEDIISYYIEPTSAVAHSRIADIPFPLRSAVVLIVRADELLAARGDSILLPGDHVYVFCRPEDRPFVGLLFGRMEE